MISKIINSHSALITDNLKHIIDSFQYLKLKLSSLKTHTIRVLRYLKSKPPNKSQAPYLIPATSQDDYKIQRRGKTIRTFETHLSFDPFKGLYKEVKSLD